MPRRVGFRIAATATAALLSLAGCGKKHDASGSAAQSTAAATPTPTASATAPSTPTASSSPEASAGSSSASPSASPTLAGLVIHIDLVDGKPKTQPEAIVKVKKGDTITIVATADKFYKDSTPYEIHVHGFDYKLELTPGQTVTRTFTADQPAGTYEVEIENTSAHLFNLQIR
jgi:hypothetical protein